MNATLKLLRTQDEPVAKLEQRRTALIAERDECDKALSGLRARRGELLLDGKATDKLDADIDALVSKERGLQDAAHAIDRRLQRAVENESLAAVVRYNERLQQSLVQLRDLLDRWELVCKEAGLVAGDILSLLDSIYVLVVDHEELRGIEPLRRIPVSMITQFGLSVCPPDELSGRAPFRQGLPMLPTYEMAMGFLRRGTPRQLLADTGLMSEKPLPNVSPPEAA